MEELAEAALEASGEAVSDALREALDGAPNAALGVIRSREIAEGPVAGDLCPGCPIAPTALESPIISPRLRAAAARCFDQWEGVSGQVNHLANAKRAARSLLAVPAVGGD